MIQWWMRRKQAKHCAHVNLHEIVGVGYRLRCSDCGRILEGPVTLSWNEDY